jgi:iron complex transport system ATP-binding protein
MRHDGRVPGAGEAPDDSVDSGLTVDSVDNGPNVDSVDGDLLIDFAKVSLRRGGKTLVGPVSWSVELDERWVVIGPNGAGKTSLLRIAAAMEHPSSGTAYVLGQKLGRVDMSELQFRVGLSSSALSQRVPDDEVVRDLVMSAGYAVLGRWREKYDEVDYERAIDTLESLGAEHLAERTYGTLSEGERKRVLIARSLMTDPELLLLDEPAAGLDLGGREDLVARLADLAADADAPAIVLVTHHVEEIPPGFSHGLLLSEGRVVASGLLTDVLTSENLSKAFSQAIVLELIDGRYFARRARTRAAHRRRA